MDLLPSRQQLVLKVASAVGETFSANAVHSVYPEQREFDEIVADLGRLVEHQFLRVSQDGTAEAYMFRHAITQEVTYNLLSFAQRRALHRAIAIHIEQTYAGRLEQHYAQLARHWRRADQPVPAMRYLELAGHQALHNHANSDATRYITEVIELALQCDASVDDRRRAGWEAIIGDANHELADYERATAHYERAITLLGRQLLGGRGRRLQALLLNASQQVVLRLWQPRPQSLSADVRGKLQLLAHIYERLSEEYFFFNDPFAVLNGTLASLNLAERSGAGPETISGFSALALGLGMSGMTRVSRFYARKALALAQRHASLPETARVHLVVGVLYYGLGEWNAAQQHAHVAKAIYSDLGDRTRRQNSETMAIFVAMLRGDFDDAERLLEILAATISVDSSSQVRAWGLSIKVLIAMTRASVDPRDLRELRALADEKLVRADQLLCLGVSAAGYLRQEDSRNALETAERGFEVLKDCQVVWGGYVYGAAGVAEVLFKEWEGPPQIWGSGGNRLRMRVSIVGWVEFLSVA